MTKRKQSVDSQSDAKKGLKFLGVLGAVSVAGVVCGSVYFTQLADTGEPVDEGANVQSEVTHDAQAEGNTVTTDPVISDDTSI